MAKKRIGIIGSTGSVGKQAAQVAALNRDLFDVVFLTAHRNKVLLCEQAEELNAAYAVLTSDSGSERVLREILEGERPDIVLHAASGIEGVRPAYAVAELGIDLALANKESVVNAGKIITEAAERAGSKIIPVDSEHSAIFQCLMGQRLKSLSSITLTASGGPFRLWTREAIGKATVADALNHPNWAMGKKISVDSATMMNKGLELIEARYFFDADASKLNVVIHPESIVHSFVTFRDGSIIAQMGNPDMRIPISFALGFPDRIPSGAEPADLSAVGNLTFEKPDLKKFPCLDIAIEILREDSNAKMIAMNSANEAAVTAFLNNDIGFSDIPRVIEETVSKNLFSDANTVEEACAYGREAYKAALSVVAKKAKTV